jgi:hypothetical protein
MIVGLLFFLGVVYLAQGARGWLSSSLYPGAGRAGAALPAVVLPTVVYQNGPLGLPRCGASEMILPFKGAAASSVFSFSPSYFPTHAGHVPTAEMDTAVVLRAEEWVLAGPSSLRTFFTSLTKRGVVGSISPPQRFLESGVTQRDYISHTLFMPATSGFTISGEQWMCACI